MMTDLGAEEMAQMIARENVQRAEQSHREAIDIVPRTFFGAGVVFLSIIVPLCFKQQCISERVRMCFLTSVVLMSVALLNCGLLFLRTNRVTQEIIDHMRPIAWGMSPWSECEVQQLRWWEIVELAVMCLSFTGSIATLVVAMFLK